MMIKSTHAAQLALDDATRVVEHSAPVDRHLIQRGQRRIDSSLSGLTAEREIHEVLYRVVPVTALTSTGAGADSAGSKEQHSASSLSGILIGAGIVLAPFILVALWFVVAFAQAFLHALANAH